MYQMEQAQGEKTDNTPSKDHLMFGIAPVWEKPADSLNTKKRFKKRDPMLETIKTPRDKLVYEGLLKEYWAHYKIGTSRV